MSDEEDELPQWIVPLRLVMHVDIVVEAASEDDARWRASDLDGEIMYTFGEVVDWVVDGKPKEDAG